MFTGNQLILEIELKDKFSPKKYPLIELSQDFSQNKKSGQTNPILQGNLHQKTASMGSMTKCSGFTWHLEQSSPSSGYRNRLHTGHKVRKPKSQLG